MPAGEHRLPRRTPTSRWRSRFWGGVNDTTAAASREHVTFDLLFTAHASNLIYDGGVGEGEFTKRVISITGCCEVIAKGTHTGRNGDTRVSQDFRSARDALGLAPVS
ncbi:hypothetical protein [Planobispora takensis]|uniref:Uncharacterized protein n=1 Tax=Planobispora takensis TaxID=1367882 RepID=A0A8J3T4N1_9ACTN|nr:hypothetical protein [Planobispora takensis]GII05247.1 hypothetical protein Pta02_72550 [Planobispora takensis]